MKITTSGLKARKADFANFVISENDGSDEVSEQKLYEIGYRAYYAYRQTEADLKRSYEANGILRRRSEKAEAEISRQTEILKLLLDYADTKSEEQENENQALIQKFEKLQRAIRLHYIDKLSKDELMQVMCEASEGINIHTQRDDDELQGA